MVKFLLCALALVSCAAATGIDVCQPSFTAPIAANFDLRALRVPKFHYTVIDADLDTPYKRPFAYVFDVCENLNHMPHTRPHNLCAKNGTSDPRVAAACTLHYQHSFVAGLSSFHPDALTVVVLWTWNRPDHQRDGVAARPVHDAGPRGADGVEAARCALAAWSRFVFALPFLWSFRYQRPRSCLVPCVCFASRAMPRCVLVRRALPAHSCVWRNAHLNVISLSLRAQTRATRPWASR